MTADFEHNSPPWSTMTKALVAVVTLILVGLLFWRFTDLMYPLVIALLLAYLLNPLITWMQIRYAMKRGRAVLIVYFGLAALVIAGGAWLGYTGVGQVGAMMENMPSILNRIGVQLQQLMGESFTRTIEIGPYSFNPAQVFGSGRTDELVAQAAGAIEPIATGTGGALMGFTQRVAGFIGYTITMFFASMYLATDFPRLGNAVSDLAHQTGYRQDADRMLLEFSMIWNAYLRGQVILGIVIGVVVAISLAIMGVSNWLLLGILSGLLEFLPLIGPFIGTAAAALTAFFQAGNWMGMSPIMYALVVVVVMTLIQSVENNVLVPRIVGDALDLHPLIVLVAVIMGAGLAGLLGAILAAPVVASLKLFGTYAWRKLLDLPPFPEPLPEPESQLVPARPTGFGSFFGKLVSRFRPQRGAKSTSELQAETVIEETAAQEDAPPAAAKPAPAESGAPQSAAAKPPAAG